jgi:hypothetical protein
MVVLPTVRNTSRHSFAWLAARWIFTSVLRDGASLKSNAYT